jgi:hypothetical protein
MERTVPSGTEPSELMSATPVYPAFLDLEPWQQGSFHFETALPGSKSLTLRDCAIAALADGISCISYPGEADDYWRMKDCLRRLGIKIDDREADEVHFEGRGGSFDQGTIELDVGQSAVTARLMLAFAALRPDVTVVDGHISMQTWEQPSSPKRMGFFRSRSAARVDCGDRCAFPARFPASTSPAC